MLDAMIRVIDDLDLNDQEKVYAAEYFDGIRDRKPALFKKGQAQEKGGSEAVSSDVN